MVVIHWCHIKLMYISSDTYMLMHLKLYVQVIEGYLVIEGYYMAYLNLSYISLENILNFKGVLLLNISSCI